MARSSSTVKDLLVYCTVALAEMKACWMGTGSREGASGVGRTWLGHLERVKAAHGGDEILSDALFDLNLLLLTGKGPHSVREFFSSGGRLQERVRSLCIIVSRLLLKFYTWLSGTHAMGTHAQQRTDRIAGEFGAEDQPRVRKARDCPRGSKGMVIMVSAPGLLLQWH